MCIRDRSSSIRALFSLASVMQISWKCFSFSSVVMRFTCFLWKNVPGRLRPDVYKRQAHAVAETDHGLTSRTFAEGIIIPGTPFPLLRHSGCPVKKLILPILLKTHGSALSCDNAAAVLCRVPPRPGDHLAHKLWGILCSCLLYTSITAWPVPQLPTKSTPFPSAWMAFKQVMCQHIYSQKSGKSGIFIQIWALEG